MTHSVFLKCFFKGAQFGFQVLLQWCSMGCFNDVLSGFHGLFTNLAPLGRVGHRVAMSVCVSVCLSVPSQNAHFRRSCRPLVEDRVPNIGLG